MKPAQPPAAFILGLGENGYGTLLSLARERVPLAGFYSSPDQMGRFSRYCKASCLDLSLSEKETVQILIERCSSFDGRPVLFATSDQYALLIAKNREQLCQHFAFHWVRAEALAQIIDKSQMTALCGAVGVLSPRTHLPLSADDVARSAADFLFPCVIKPIRNFATASPPGFRSVIANSPEALVAFYRANPRLIGQTIWQEIIEGGDDEIFQCTVLIRESGEIGAVFVTRKIRQSPAGYGNMCFGRSEENRLLVEPTVNLLRHVNYRGVASVEFKRRLSDGRFYFIEINPRLPWYNALFRAAGVNLAFLTYLDLTHFGRSAHRFNPPQKNGVYWLSFAGDFCRFLGAGSDRPNCLGWLMTIAKARAHAWFSWRDPKPFLHASTHLLGSRRRKLRKNTPSISLKPLYTRFLARNDSVSSHDT